MKYFHSKSNSFFALEESRVDLIEEKTIQTAYNYAKIFSKEIDPLNDFITQNLDVNLSEIFDNYFSTCAGGVSHG